MKAKYQKPNVYSLYDVNTVHGECVSGSIANSKTGSLCMPGGNATGSICFPGSFAGGTGCYSGLNPAGYGCEAGYSASQPVGCNSGVTPS